MTHEARARDDSEHPIAGYLIDFTEQQQGCGEIPCTTVLRRCDEIRKRLPNLIAKLCETYFLRDGMGPV